MLSKIIKKVLLEYKNNLPEVNNNFNCYETNYYKQMRYQLDEAIAGINFCINRIKKIAEVTTPDNLLSNQIINNNIGHTIFTRELNALKTKLTALLGKTSADYFKPYDFPNKQCYNALDVIVFEYEYEKTHKADMTGLLMKDLNVLYQNLSSNNNYLRYEDKQSPIICKEIIDLFNF